MPLAKQPVQVTMRGLDTRTGTKLLAPGRMTLAQNVRQRERGVYGKRWGASPYVKTASSGTIATSLGLVSAGGALTLRTADSAYTYDAVRSLWLLRGAVSRLMPSYAPATSRAYPGSAFGPINPGYKPSQISSGGYTWHFSGLQEQAVSVLGQTLHSWVYRVVDSATGAEIVGETTIATATSWQAKAVVAGGFVWLFMGTGQYIYALKFNPAAPTVAPVLTTYLDTGGGAAVFYAWDVLATSNGGALVAIMGAGAANNLSRLDTATGLAGTPVTMAPGWGFSAFGSLAFVKNETGTSGNYYLLAIDGTSSSWRYLIINSTTLAITAPGTYFGVAAAGSGNMACGYRDQGSGVVVAFTSKAGTTPATDVISRNAVVWKRGASLLGEPFQVGATWYLPVLYDDNAASLQRSYAILDATTGAIVARTLYGLGGSVYQHASQFAPSALDASWITPVTVAGNVASLDVDSFDGTNYSSMALAFDFGAVPSPPAAVMQGQASVMAGGWPAYLSGRVTEWPGLFPHPLVATEAAQAGTGPAAGTYKLAACYVVRDNFGNLTRSAPSAIIAGVITTVNKYISLPVPTLRMTNGATAEVFIEPYVSAVGGTTLFRQPPQPNNPTIDSVTFQLGFGTPLLTGTEVLYTQSGELANDPPPPCRLVAAWRNRVLCSGTDAAGEVWPSKEIQPGKGIEFSGGLMFMIPGDTGAIRAMGPVDHNYFAFFKQDGTWAVSGTGPDSQGRGNYEPVRLAGDRGCTNPASLCSSKAGLYFQALDGGIYLLDSALQVSEQVVDGMYGYRAQAVTGAVDLPSQRQVRFYLADGTALVLDWGNASAENPVGEWYIDTGVNGVGGATVHNDVPHHAAADGTVAREVSGQWFDGTVTPILRKMRLPLTLSGVRGYQRLFRGQVVGQYRGQHSLKVTFDAYSGASGETGGTSQNWVKVVSAGPELVEFRPTVGRVSIFDLTVEDTGADLTEGGTLDGIGLEIGIKPGLPRVGSAQRF